MARDKTDKTDETSAATATLDFRQAVDLAKQRLTISSSWIKGAGGDDAFVRRLRAVDAEKSLIADPRFLLAYAETSAEGFDLLCETVASMIEAGHRLPEDARGWVVDFLRGNVKRPKASAGRPQKRFNRFQIWSNVDRLVRDGKMLATRNDTSDETSACDAVATALRELGMEPASYSSVKKVWLDVR